MNVPMLLRTAFLSLALAALSVARADVVFGEDFSSALATGIANASDYTPFSLSPNTYTTQGYYKVVSNPAPPTFTNPYDSFYDHTTGDAKGAMLLFDGAPSASTRIYDHAIPMLAGTTYTITYWGHVGTNNDNPVLHVSIDGTTRGAEFDTNPAGWTQSPMVTYTPTTTGLHTLAIYDSNTDAGGNDGAIDDLLVTAPAATPEPATLAALGLGALGLLRRRKGPRRFLFAARE